MSAAAIVDAAPGARSRGWAAVLAVVLASLALRATALWLARDAEPWNDQITYVQRAEDLLDGKGYTGSYQSWVKHPGERQMRTLPRYPGAYQAPGFPAFVALVMGVAGRGADGLVWVKLAQVLLGAATTWLVYRVGLAWYGHGVGVAAAWFHALDPTFIAFTHYLFTETLFVFLFTAGMLALTRSRGPSSLAVALGTGACFALAAYVKSSVVYLLPLLAAWYAWRHRAQLSAALRWVAVAAAAWCACIAPWTIRNWQVHGGLVLIDSSGPYNFWRGNQGNAYQRRRYNSDYNVRFAEPFSAWSMAPVAEVGGDFFVRMCGERAGTPTPSDLQIMQAANAAAVEFIREDPLWSIQRAGYKIVDLWNPTSFVMRHLGKQGYGELPRALELALSWACVLSYLLVMALAAAALWRLRDERFARLVLLLMLYYTAIHAVTFGLTRFRLPVMPFLMVLAGWSAVQLLGRRRARGAA